MLEYLETKNLLDKELGSRPGKSTVTAGVALKQNIVDSNDKERK